MRCVCKAAISIDGYMDDTSAERLLLSDAVDLDAVDELRAEFDAILVGAETLRKDNPSFLLRSKERCKSRRADGKSEHPRVCILSRTAEIPLNLQIFEASRERPIIFYERRYAQKVREDLGHHAQLIGLEAEGDVVTQVLAALVQEGLQSLLVEGGAKTLHSFLQHPNIEYLRLAIAPRYLGARGAAALFPLPAGLELSCAPFTPSGTMSLTKARVLKTDG